ncbi:MAG: MBL fold metallo-hydrolase [Burkholderiaceae bacterium]
MIPLQLFDPASSTYTYIPHDSATREALIIDPVDARAGRDLAVLQAHGLTLRWAVETHNHADHITSAGLLAELPPWGTHGSSRRMRDGEGTASVQPAQGDALWALGAKPAGAWPRPGIRRAACPTRGAAMCSQGCPCSSMVVVNRFQSGNAAASLQHHPGAVLPAARDHRVARA